MNIKCLATGSSGNCYLVDTGCGCIILDAGINFDKIVSNVNLNDVIFAFISHEQKDHSKSASKLLSRRVKVIGGNLGQDFTKNVIEGKNGSKLEVYTFPILHGECENYGIIVQDANNGECLLYCTDFNICEWDLRDFKFTQVMVECNYCEDYIAGIDSYKVKRQINTHMGLNGIQVFLDTLDLSICKKILLVHQSQGLGDSITMGSTIYAKYRIPTGVCKQYGGIEYYG